MLVILSPAKDMKVLTNKNLDNLDVSMPEFLQKAEKIISELKRHSSMQLCDLMTISDKLAQLNFCRFQNWKKEHTFDNSAPSILSFTGEAFRGLRAQDLNSDQLNYSQHVLRILSGLYGVLRPLDLIEEYRLEMGTKHFFLGKANLYKYWETTITKSIKRAIENSPGEKVLVNLASTEYTSVIDFKTLKSRVVTPVFKDESQGKMQIVAVYAKKARGMMTRFIIENQLDNVDDLKAFDAEGYYFDNANSTSDKLFFKR